jgi:hypothetical protein
MKTCCASSHEDANGGHGRQVEVASSLVALSSYRRQLGRSKVRRARAKAPAAKVAIPAPAARRNRRESNHTLGATYGNRLILGFTFDDERYAIQTRLPAFGCRAIDGE